MSPAGSPFTFVALRYLQVRKFRTLTELIMDAEEHVKNPYKGKKLKVLGRSWSQALKGDLSLPRVEAVTHVAPQTRVALPPEPLRAPHCP